MKWYAHYWYVIEDIYNQRNRRPPLQAFRELGEYIPCGKCKTHFLEYIEREPFDSLWLSKLKKEIADKIPRKPSGECCKGASQPGFFKNF